jgi:hypothetical protein
VSEQQANYDSPWKEALEQYFEAFLAFFFPHLHTEINWQRGYEFLDKELQQILKQAEVGQYLSVKNYSHCKKPGFSKKPGFCSGLSEQY